MTDTHDQGSPLDTRSGGEAGVLGPLDEVFDAPAASPGWVQLAGAGSAGSARLVQPRLVLAQVAAGVVATLLIVTVLGAFAARRLAEREAVNDAATMAGVIAEALIQPSLTPDVIAGDPQAIGQLDTRIRQGVLSDQVVRVKLWRPDGVVLYADEAQLIGQRFALDADQQAALDGPMTVADVSDLSASENEFERADRLVEVYRPVWGANGEPLLFEMYVSYAPVAERTSQLWRGFAGVTASSLLVLTFVGALLGWHLVRRLRRSEDQRVELLQRAVDASGDERRRIAGSLHDGPVQALAAASFTLAGASATARGQGNQALANDLDAAAAAVRGSIRSLRTLLVDIYPASLARSGVVVALHDLAQSVRSPELTVEVDSDPEDELALSNQAQRLVHRVTQECLRNAARHAGQATVAVALHREGPDTVTLDIVDDGAGFDVPATLAEPEHGHLGLQLLADVADVAGASLLVSSAPGCGTHWRLELSGALAARA